MLVRCLKFMACAFLALTCSAAGAARGDPVPKPIDPFDELVDSTLLVPSQVSFYNPLYRSRVGLVISKNAELQMAWNKDSLRPSGLDAFFVSALGISPQLQELAAKFLDPNDLKEAILVPFLLRAREVRIFPDLQAFRDSAFDVVAIIDVNFVRSVSGMFVRDFEYGMRLDAHLLDKELRRGPTISGRSLIKTSSEGAGTWDALFRSRLVAIEKFQAHAEQVVGPVKPQQVEPTVLGAGTMESRLEALESMRRRGLISDEEARQRRKQILQEM